MISPLCDTGMIQPRPSPIAGTWYPGTVQALTRSVDAQLERARPKRPAGDLVALVVPHAGHRYSGDVAALAFRLLQGASVETVAIVAPMHHPYPGRILTSAHPAYETPLGLVEIDAVLVTAVDAGLPAELHLDRVRNDPEHSLEIELPFLQRTLSGPFRLVPLMLRDQSAKTAEALGRALGQALKGRSSLLVASSDLSHFYPDDVARKLDAFLLARLEAFDPDGVIDADERGRGYACGRGAIASVLWAAQDLGATRVELLGYANSGDVTGDTSSVVGYGAAAVVRAPEARVPRHDS
jgi:AmmeMemoRadiSam system protein B